MFLRLNMALVEDNKDYLLHGPPFTQINSRELLFRRALMAGIKKVATSSMTVSSSQ